MLVNQESAELLEGWPTGRLLFFSRSLERHHFNLHNFGRADPVFESVDYILSKIVPSSSKCQVIPPAIQDGKLDRASGPLIRTSDRRHQTSFHAVARSGEAQSMQMLVHHSSPIYRDAKGQTPLHIAVKYNYPAMARFFCACGANQDARDCNGLKPIDYAHSESEFDWIFRVGYKLEQKDVNGETALLLFSKKNNLYVVISLLQQGAHTEEVDSGGRTALATACNLGHERIARVLIGYGAHVDVESYCNNTPLYYAARSGSVSIVRLLIQSGAQIEHEGKGRKTALIAASKYGQAEVVDLLLSEGANARCYDDNGNTPLLYAAEFGHLSILQLLLDEGDADIDEYDDDGLTALCVAAREGHESLVRELVARGASLQAQTSHGRTPIDEAEAMGRGPILVFLKEQSKWARRLPSRYHQPRHRLSSRVVRTVRYVKKSHPERYLVAALVIASAVR